MEKVSDDEIDLLDLASYLLTWVWLIVICGVVTAAIAFGIAQFGMTPKYESTTKIYVLNKQNSNTVTSSDLSVGTQLVKDYREMIKSRFVLETVIEECGLSDSYEKLNGRVTVSTPSDTRMIYITVKDPDPVRAKEIVDTIRDVAGDRIVSVMDLQAVNVVDEGNISSKPSSPNKKKMTLIGFAAGAFLCAAVLSIVHLSDDRIKTADDVEKYLGLSTLASIPLSEEKKNVKKDSEHGRRSSEERSRHHSSRESSEE